VPKVVPKVDGVSAREIMKFEIVNEALIPRQYLMVNEKAIGAYGRAAKAAARIPGVRFYAEESVAVKAY
jgi:hypothetical protein